MKKAPKLCKNAKGIYYVYVKRRRVYLGKGTPSVIEVRYKELLRRLLDDKAAPETFESNDDVMLVELSAKFLAAHVGYYKNPGKQDKQLARFKTALSFPLALFPEIRADDFGAKKLLVCREAMIASDRFSRAYINALVVCLRHVFTWGVERELVKPETLVALRAVSPLRRGRVNVKENDPVVAVASEVVDKTLPYLRPVVQAIVTVQRHTGMRPTEVLTMRVRDLVKVKEGYTYTLVEDKTSYRRRAGEKRVVNLGRHAAKAVKPYLVGKPDDAFVFPVGKDVYVPYKPTSYGRAISRAAAKAGVPHWTPYQLRHLFATEVRARFGLEAAQTALGHKNADVTQIYAERDATLAAKVAAALG